MVNKLENTFVCNDIEYNVCVEVVGKEVVFTGEDKLLMNRFMVKKTEDQVEKMTGEGNIRTGINGLMIILKSGFAGEDDTNVSCYNTNGFLGLKVTCKTKIGPLKEEREFRIVMDAIKQDDATRVSNMIQGFEKRMREFKMSIQLPITTKRRVIWNNSQRIIWPGQLIFNITKRNDNTLLEVSGYLSVLGNGEGHQIWTCNATSYVGMIHYYAHCEPKINSLPCSAILSGVKRGDQLLTLTFSGNNKPFTVLNPTSNDVPELGYLIPKSLIQIEEIDP